MNLSIAQAEQDELPIVHRIMREAFEQYRDQISPQSGALREQVTDIMDKIRNRGGALLVRDGEKPIGSAQYYFKDHYMYLGRISVINQARGHGVGKMIVQYLEGFARENGVGETRLEVRLSLPDNVLFYKRLGYEVLEEHEYPEKTDRWYVMRKDLSIRDE